jgi:hypothetical protein
MHTKLLRRALALLLCLVMGLSLNSCSLAEQLRATFAPLSKEKGISGASDLTYTDTSADNAAADTSAAPDYTPLSSRYAYACLGEGQRALYDGLLNVVDRISEKSDGGDYLTEQVILDGVVLSDAAIAVAVSALCDDNPSIFWTAQAYTWVTDEDAGYTAVQLCSAYSPDEVIAMRRELDTVLSSFYASVPNGLSKYDREKLVHDYLIDSCAYDEARSADTSLTPENLKAHSVYGALVEKRCVCEGYGTAMQLLLNGLGVECVTLTGKAYNSADGESDAQKILHLWNAVKLDDGCWYHVDPTWDDQENTVQQYNYFNLCDELILADHTLSPTPDELGEAVIDENGTDDMNLFIPSCDATTYYYYSYELPHLTSYDAAALDDSLYAAATRRDAYYVFYVEPTLGYDAALSALFDEEQTFFDLIMRVNARLDSFEIDDTNVMYYKNEPRRSIAVQLNFL